MSSSFKMFLLGILILPCALLFGACGEKSSAKIEIEKVEVTGVVTSFKVNDDFTVGENAKVTIKTSDKKQLTYDTTGLIYDNATNIATAEQYTIDYSSYDKTKAGTYSIIVKSKEKVNITAQYDVVVSLYANTWATTPNISGWQFGQTASVPTGSATNGDIVFEYKLATAEDTAYSATVPTNAGNYKMRAKVVASSVYAELKHEVEFSIAKIKLANPTADTTTFTYTGAEQTYNINGENLDKMAITNNKRTDAGSQQVSVALVDGTNYEWETPVINNIVNFEFAIAQAANSLTTQLSIANWTYGQTASVPTGVAKFGQVVFEYKLATEEDTAYSTTVPTNAGAYKVRASVVATSNYTALSEEIEFSIAKVGLAKPTADTTEFYYTGDEQTYNIVCEDATLFNITDNLKTDAGTYSVGVDIKNKVNYGWNNGESAMTDEALTFDFVILKANNTWTVSPSITGWSYGEAVNVPTGEAKYGDVVFEYKLASAENDAYTTTTPSNVGSYVVRASVLATTNYNGISSTRDFEITKSNVVKPTADTTSFVYNEQAQTYNVVGGDATKFTVTNNVQTDVGTYNVTVSLIDTENYQWADGTITDLTFEFVIAIQKIAKPTADTTKFVYNEEEQTYNVVCEDKTKFTVTNNVQTNAGTYNITVSLKDTENCQWADGTTTPLEFLFKIEKQIVEIPAISSKIYTGETLTAEVPSSPYYVINQNLGGIVAGRYDVKILLSDAINYKWEGRDDASISLDFWIVSNENSWNETFTFSGWIYGETPTTPSANTQYGEAQFTYLALDDLDASWTTVQPVEVGNYKIKATVPATAEYSSLEAIVSFEIQVAEVEYPTIESKEYDGSEQTADIDLSSIYDILENNGGTDVGEYDVKLKLKNLKNYKWKTNDLVVENILTLKFVITKVTNTWENEIHVNDFDYGDTPSEPSGSAKFGTITFDYKVKGADDSTYTTVKPTEAGEYVLRGKVEGTDNWTALEDVYEFKINKASVSVNKNFDMKTFNGKLQKLEIKENLEYIALNNNGFTNAGEYEITLQLKDADNFVWNCDGQIVDEANLTVKFIIEKAMPTNIPIIDVAIAYVGDFPNAIELPEGFTIKTNGFATAFNETGLITLNGEYQHPDTANYNPANVPIVVAVYNENLNIFLPSDFVIQNTVGTYDEAGTWGVTPVQLLNNAVGATISYNEVQNSELLYDSYFSYQQYVYSEAGDYYLYFRVQKDGYNPYYGFTTLTINKKDLEFIELPNVSDMYLVGTKLDDIYVEFDSGDMYCNVVWDNPDEVLLKGKHSYAVTIKPSNSNYNEYKTNIEIEGVEIPATNISINGDDYALSELFHDIDITLDRLSEFEISFDFDDEKYAVLCDDKTLINKANEIHKFKFNSISGSFSWYFTIDEKSVIDAFLLSGESIHDFKCLQSIYVGVDIDEHIKKLTIHAGDNKIDAQLNNREINVTVKQFISGIDVEMEEGYTYDMYLNGVLFDKQKFNNNVFKFGLNTINIVVKDNNNAIVNYVNYKLKYESLDLVYVTDHYQQEWLGGNIVYTYAPALELRYKEGSELYRNYVEDNGSVKFYYKGTELTNTTINLYSGLNTGYYAEMISNDGVKVIHELGIYVLETNESSPKTTNTEKHARVAGLTTNRPIFYTLNSNDAWYIDRPLSISDVQICRNWEDNSDLVEDATLTLSNDGKYLTIKYMYSGAPFVKVTQLVNVMQMPITEFKVDMYIKDAFIRDYQPIEFNIEGKASYDVTNHEELCFIDYGSNAIVTVTGDCIGFDEDYGMYKFRGEAKEYIITIVVANNDKSISKTYQLTVNIKPVFVASISAQKDGTNQEPKTLSMVDSSNNSLPTFYGEMIADVDMIGNKTSGKYMEYLKNVDILGSDGEVFELNKPNTDGKKYVAIKIDYNKNMFDGITLSQDNQVFVDITKNVLVALTEKEYYYEGVIYLYESRMGYVPILIYLMKENVNIYNVDLGINISVPQTDSNAQFSFSESTKIVQFGDIMFTEGTYIEEGFILVTGKFVGFEETTYRTEFGEDGKYKVYTMDNEYIGKLGIRVPLEGIRLIEVTTTCPIPEGTQFIFDTTGVPSASFVSFDEDIVNYYINNNNNESVVEFSLNNNDVVVEYVSGLNENNEENFTLVEDNSSFTPYMMITADDEVIITLKLTFNEGTANEKVLLMVFVFIIDIPLW